MWSLNLACGQKTTPMTEFMRAEMPSFKAKAFKDSDEYKYTQQCEWIDEPQIWKDIEGLDELTMIHFMGGETYGLQNISRYYNVLQMIQILTLSRIIRYNTNGTFRPTEELINIWDKFMRIPCKYR